MFTAKEWLLIGLANAHGFDKKNFAERLEMGKRLQYVDPATAENAPYATAMMDGLNGNENVMVGLDASASGFQMLAALANCRKTAYACNLIGSECNDAYEVGISHMPGLSHIPRKDKKKSMMTTMYGSVRTPRELLGEENLPEFYKMLQEQFTGVWNIFLHIQSKWRADVPSHRWTMPDGFEVIQWNEMLQETPVVLWGQEVTVRKKVKCLKERGLSLAANLTHSVDALICREMVKRAQINPDVIRELMKGFPKGKNEKIDHLLRLYRKTNFLSVDLIHNMDRDTYADLDGVEKLEIVCLMEHLAAKEQFYIIPVHDQYSCKAEHCNDMVSMYRYVMQQLWDSGIYESIIEDITGEYVPTVKYPLELDGLHMIS